MAQTQTGGCLQQAGCALSLGLLVLSCHCAGDHGFLVDETKLGGLPTPQVPHPCQICLVKLIEFLLTSP